MIGKKIRIEIIILVLIAILGIVISHGYYVVRTRKQVYDVISREIDEIRSKFNGESAIYIKDIRTGIAVQYNEGMTFPSASLVKIPVMASVFHAVKEGKISFNDRVKLTKRHKVGGSGKLKRYRSGNSFTVEQLVNLMIVESDNTATNMLTDLLGFEYINRTFREKLNLSVTNLSRDVMDLRSRNTGIENLTTAGEMGGMLEAIYRGKLVSDDASKKMLSILKEQKINDRIPRYLPDDVLVAHKTGLMNKLCHDAGIIFTRKGDFIVCVLTGKYRKTSYAKRFIGEISYTAFRAYL